MRVGSELTDRTEPVLYLSVITHNCVTCRLGPIGFNEAVSGKLRDTSVPRMGDAYRYRGYCTATKIPFMYSFSGNCTDSVTISKFM
jgi:hypothetical protein